MRQKTSKFWLNRHFHTTLKKHDFVGSTFEIEGDFIVALSSKLIAIPEVILMMFPTPLQRVFATLTPAKFLLIVCLYQATSLE